MGRSPVPPRHGAAPAPWWRWRCASRPGPPLRRSRPSCAPRPPARVGGRVHIQRHLAVAAQEALRVEPAQHQVGIGDGRLCAAAAIAGRAGNGARRCAGRRAGRRRRRDRPRCRRPRPRCECRSPAGAAGRSVITALGRGGDRAGAERHIGAGPAHVKGDQAAARRCPVPVAPRQRRRRRRRPARSAPRAPACAAACASPIAPPLDCMMRTWLSCSAASSRCR